MTIVPQPRLVIVGGVPMSALVAEAPDPRAVIVAIHGGGTTALYFDCPGHPESSLLRAGAAHGYTVVALDRPGYGSSAPYPEAVARQRVTEAGLARLDELAEDGDVDEDTANVYRQLFELRLERVRAALGDDDADSVAPRTSGIRHELVRAERAKLDELYQNGKISDEIRRSIALTLDEQDGQRGGLPHT